MHVRRGVLTALGLLVLAFPASAQQTEPFEGRWRGTWSNSLGESGEDSLDLAEDANGRLRGMWTDDVAVTGQRTGPNTAVLRGRTATRVYEVSVFVQRGRMTLSYSAARLDDRGAYYGRSSLALSR